MVFFLISRMVLLLLNQLQYLIIVVPDRIAMAFNRSGATRVVAVDISVAFDKI